MGVILATFLILALAMALLAVGAILGRRSLRGSRCCPDDLDLSPCVCGDPHRCKEIDSSNSSAAKIEAQS